MKTTTLEERTYYRIESPGGIISDSMTENELTETLKVGFFKVLKYSAGYQLGYVIKTKKYKVGKIYKYVRKTTLTEEVVVRNLQ